MKRREFSYTLGMSGLSLLAGARLPGMTRSDEVKVTILHTNDVHSHIDPFPMDGGRNQGKGGAARRAAMIKAIRARETNVLLMDAGDILQGTPYFNYFDGELEFELMDRMGYDVATIGNHDYDGGIDLLAKRISESDFSMLNANYILKDTVLHERVQPYQIYEYEGIKIGVTAVGIELDGLVPKELYGDCVYTDPVAAATKQALWLKQEAGCDYVVCLSHLGLYYRGEKVSDQVMAEQSRGIDFIIGGHTHSFMRDPDVVKNLDDEPVLINQVGFAGLILGRIDLSFERSKKSVCSSCSTQWVEDWSFTH